jgi:hypothetical protein
MNKVKDGLAPIYARVIVDARRIEISLKRFINPVEWNGKKGVARGNREEVKSLNHYLEEVRSKLVGCFAATRKCKSKNTDHGRWYHCLNGVLICGIFKHCLAQSSS